MESHRSDTRELARLREEVRRLQGRLSHLVELGERVASSLDLPSVLQQVVDGACDLTDARYGALAVFGEDGGILEFVTRGVAPGQRERMGAPPRGLGLLGWLNQHRRPVRIADLTAHPSFAGFPPNHPPMKSFLGSSILDAGNVLGNIYLTEKTGAAEFTSEDEEALALFAGQAALAIRNARLYQGVAAERSRMEAILTNSPYAIIYADAVTGLVQANRHAEEMLGRTVGPQAGMEVLDNIRSVENGQPLAPHQHPLHRALGGETLPGQEHVIGDSASGLHVLCSAAPVTDVQGAVQGAILQFQDLTSVREGQRALAESEARQRAILDNTTAVIYIKDTEGRYILINRRGESLFHVEQEAIRGRTDRDIFPAELADSLRANDKRVLESRAPVEMEETVPQDDGLHTYLSVKFPLFDGNGVPYAVCGISTDITERKRAEGALEAEHRRLEALVDTSPVGVFVVESGTGKVVLVNREAERILGIPGTPHDSLDKYQEAVVYRRPDGQKFQLQDRPLTRALARGETVRAEEVRLELPGDRTVPVLVNATPIYSSDGEITGAVAVIQDITPLEELESLRSEFLGMVSHELRTPLTAIKGSAATVLGSRTPFDERETREFFQIIDEQADRLRDLVNNLLDMSRIEAGSLSVSTSAVDLREVVDEAQATFLLLGTEQELLVRLPEEVPVVDADRRRISQVLDNLLSNASKFSPSNAPVAVQVEADSGHVTVSVRDHGRGIPPEKTPYLFRKFSQVHSDSGGKLSGSGLGLAICKGIVEAHGGRIWAESGGEGMGTTFSFTLPVVEAEKAPAHVALDPSHRADHLGKVRRSGERTRVLAVDDEVQVLRYLQGTLERAGYQVLVTTDPSQVTSLVEAEQPEIVLLDLMFPGASGFELLKAIREISGVPVIFISGRDREEDTVRALRLGADDYIIKPFSPSELQARIEACLRRRVLPDQVEVRPPLVLGQLTIDFARRRAIVSGKELQLTATEYKLLYQLAINAGRVLTHDQILQSVWGPEYSGETQLVRSFIRNIRRKLGDDANNPRFIFTEPQVGYRMAKP